MLAALKNAVPEVSKLSGVSPSLITRAAIVRDVSKLQYFVDASGKLAEAAKRNPKVLPDLVKKELNGGKNKLRHLLLLFARHRRSTFFLCSGNIFVAQSCSIT